MAGGRPARGPLRTRCRRDWVLIGGLTFACGLGVLGCSKPEPPASPPPDVLVAEVTKGYREGSTVKAGQVLYQLDPRQYQADLDKAQGDLAQAKANLQRSQLNEAKYRPLVAVGAVSRREYDDTVQEVRANEAAVEAAKGAVEAAKLNLAWTTIMSPIDGVAGIPRPRSATSSRPRPS